MQLTSRGRLRPLRGGGWAESRQFSQPDASLPAIPALAAAAADTLWRPLSLREQASTPRRKRTSPRKRGYSPGSLLYCNAQPPLPRKHSSGQPAQSRQSDANIVPQALHPPPGWEASEPAFSARDVQFFGNCHRTCRKVSSQYQDHSLSPFTEGQLPLRWLVIHTVKSQRRGS